MVYYFKVQGADCQLFLWNVLTIFHEIAIQVKQFHGNSLTVFHEITIQVNYFMGIR